MVAYAGFAGPPQLTFGINEAQPGESDPEKRCKVEAFSFILTDSTNGNSIAGRRGYLSSLVALSLLGGDFGFTLIFVEIHLLLGSSSPCHQIPTSGIICLSHISTEHCAHIINVILTHSNVRTKPIVPMGRVTHVSEAGSRARVVRGTVHVKLVRPSRGARGRYTTTSCPLHLFVLKNS